MDFGPMVYYGSSKDLISRKASHMRNLKRGKRSSERLASAYQEHGLPNFAPIAYCKSEALARELEQLILELVGDSPNILNTQKNVHQEYNGTPNPIVFQGILFGSYKEAYEYWKPKCGITCFKSHVKSGASTMLELYAQIDRAKEKIARKKPYKSSRLCCYYNGRFYDSFLKAYECSFVNVSLIRFREFLKKGYESDLEFWVSREAVIDGKKFWSNKAYTIYSGQPAPKMWTKILPIEDVRRVIRENNYCWVDYKRQITKADFLSDNITEIESCRLGCYFNSQWHKFIQGAYDSSKLKNVYSYARFRKMILEGARSDNEILQRKCLKPRKSKKRKLTFAQLTARESA